MSEQPTQVDGQQELDGMPTPATPTVEEIVADLVDEANPAEWTPYTVHTIVNGAFEVLEHPRRIPPQMMYTYDNNGLIVKGVKKARRFTRDQVKAFATKFVTRQINR
jgi:hypothetical protein